MLSPRAFRSSANLLPACLSLAIVNGGYNGLSGTAILEELVRQGGALRGGFRNTPTELATNAQTVQMNYPNRMDHVEVLREKIGRLRVEIAQIQELNNQYRLQGRNGAEAQVAHGQRQERLQAIQLELAQLASLGRKPQLVKQMTKKHGSRLRLVKKAS